MKGQVKIVFPFLSRIKTNPFSQQHHAPLPAGVRRDALELDGFGHRAFCQRFGLFFLPLSGLLVLFGAGQRSLVGLGFSPSSPLLEANHHAFCFFEGFAPLRCPPSFLSSCSSFKPPSPSCSLLPRPLARGGVRGGAAGTFGVGACNSRREGAYNTLPKPGLGKTTFKN